MTEILDLPSLDLDDIERLDIRDGDTVLVRSHPAAPVTQAAAAGISEVLNKHRKKITVLVVPREFDIARLDEDQMAALGWVRPPRRKPRKPRAVPKGIVDLEPPPARLTPPPAEPPSKEPT